MRSPTFILLTVAILVPYPAQATLMFKAPAIFDIQEDALPGLKPYGDQFSGAVADLNGDGRDDIIISNYNSSAGWGTGSTVSVLLGATPPGPPTLLQTRINYGGTYSVLGVVDCNGDLKLDLIQARTDSLSVLLGNGVGGFGARVDTYTGYAKEVAIGDVNGDNRPDAVYKTPGVAVPDTTWTFLGNGLGGFTAGPITFGTKNGGSLYDVNQDGKLDLMGYELPSFVTVSLGNGDGSFQPPILSSTSASIVGFAVADFDSDGRPDVAVTAERTGPASSFIAILHGLGNGSFIETSTIPIPDAGLWGIGARDMDGDGRRDLVVVVNRLAYVTVAEGVKTVLVLFGDGAGNFPDQRFLDGGNLTNPLLGDFDGDGLVDIASPAAFDFLPVTSAAHALSVLRNLGGREFGGGLRRATLSESRAQSVADLNGDGNPDLIVSGNNGTFEVHLGDGMGGFTSIVSNPCTPLSSPSRFAVGDLNRDGKLDLVGSSVNLMYGNGDGTFATGGPIGTTGGPVEQSLADLDRDGILDIILLDTSSLNVAKGLPGGTFAAGNSYSGLSSPRELAVADWNRDGKLDVAVANQGGIVTYLGNGDGTLAAPSTLDPSRDYRDVTVGDFNRDGALDLAGRSVVPMSSSPSANGISIFLGNGSGGFGPRIPRGVFDRDGSEIVSWDVNRDGSPDLVATSRGDLTSTSEVAQNSNFWTARVMLGNGTGDFGRDSDYLIGVAPGLSRTGFGDLNRDGQIDIIGRNVDYVTDESLVSYLSILRGAMPGFTGSFPSHTEFATGTGPLDLAVADFNRDGKLDVASLGAGSGAVTVHAGNGTGGLGAGSSFPVGLNAEALSSGDVNRDGAIDLVTSSSVDLMVLLGNGTGGFAPAVGYPIGSDITGVALGDMNRDGKLDAVVASTGDGAVNITLGNGAGAFAPSTQFSTPGVPGQVALGDLDGDGDLDVVTFDHNLGDVFSLLGNGGGGLGSAATFAFGSGTRDIVLGDWNRDGYLDVALTRVVGGSGFMTTAVGLGDGTFAAASSYPVSSDVRYLSVVDYNLDGIVDIVAGNGAGGSLSLFRGLGNGAFLFAVTITGAGAPAAAAVADMDRDGQPDLISVNSTANNISIFLGSDSPLSGVEVAGAPARGLRLLQNRPNPFNPRTSIGFTLPQSGPVRLRVFDPAGRLVATLADRSLPAGTYQFPWDGRDRAGRSVASGVYFYQLEALGIRRSNRMTLLK
jgi:hypothetical protein